MLGSLGSIALRTGPGAGGHRGGAAFEQLYDGEVAQTLPVMMPCHNELHCETISVSAAGPLSPIPDSVNCTSDMAAIERSPEVAPSSRRICAAAV